VINVNLLQIFVDNTNFCLNVNTLMNLSMAPMINVLFVVTVKSKLAQIFNVQSPRVR
jgi:hypothetical protein